MTDIDKILSIKQTKLKPAQGKFLISEPFSNDFFFKRSVVLLAEHNEEGSFGLIINKAVDYTLSEVTDDFPYFDAKVFLGGPVKTDSIFFLHTLGDIIPNSMHIFNNIHWGGDIEVVKDLMLANKLSQDNIRFFLGYSGWKPNQLDSELKRDSWIVSKADSKMVMNQDTDDLWRDTVKNLGKDYNMWMNFPLDPNMN
ncbi:YqgE/AlgH family protein [Bacteroidota bacterium]